MYVQCLAQLFLNLHSAETHSSFVFTIFCAIENIYKKIHCDTAQVLRSRISHRHLDLLLLSYHHPSTIGRHYRSFAFVVLVNTCSKPRL